MYERAQAGLHSRGSQWVNMSRLFSPLEHGQTNVVTNGTSEQQMREQYRAWVRYMTADMVQGAAA
jgi:benzoate/toluate 1,2-dioxygenase subunit alpha